VFDDDDDDDDDDEDRKLSATTASTMADGIDIDIDIDIDVTNNDTRMVDGTSTVLLADLVNVDSNEDEDEDDAVSVDKSGHTSILSSSTPGEQVDDNDDDDDDNNVNDTIRDDVYGDRDDSNNYNDDNNRNNIHNYFQYNYSNGLYLNNYPTIPDYGGNKTVYDTMAVEMNSTDKRNMNTAADDNGNDEDEDDDDDDEGFFVSNKNTVPFNMLEQQPYKHIRKEVLPTDDTVGMTEESTIEDTGTITVDSCPIGDNAVDDSTIVETTTTELKSKLNPDVNKKGTTTTTTTTTTQTNGPNQIKTRTTCRKEKGKKLRETQSLKTGTHKEGEDG